MQRELAGSAALKGDLLEAQEAQVRPCPCPPPPSHGSRLLRESCSTSLLCKGSVRIMPPTTPLRACARACTPLQVALSNRVLDLQALLASVTTSCSGAGQGSNGEHAQAAPVGGALGARREPAQTLPTWGRAMSPSKAAAMQRQLDAAHREAEEARREVGGASSCSPGRDHTSVRLRPRPVHAEA
jgi:hypothetical protein